MSLYSADKTWNTVQIRNPAPSGNMAYNQSNTAIYTQRISEVRSTPNVRYSKGIRDQIQTMVGGLGSYKPALPGASLRDYNPPQPPRPMAVGAMTQNANFLASAYTPRDVFGTNDANTARQSR